jgi:ABC-2 type transport system permease protein/lipopolysaccharide transport system permease protein
VLVFLRDLRHVLPIILQLGLFATPVAYGMDVVTPSLQVAYSIANPLAPVIDGYRRTMLLGLAPDWHLLGPAAVAAALWLAVGYVVFKRLEPGFADYA